MATVTPTEVLTPLDKRGIRIFKWAQIAASDHDGIGFDNDIVDVLKRLGRFNLGNNFCPSPNDIFCHPHIITSLDE